MSSETHKSETSAPIDPRRKIVEALMALAAEQPFEDITISDICARAGVSLADFRDAFPSKGAVLASLSKIIDRKVLEGVNDDLAAEPARDRLFDVLMRRLDAMAPYKEGLRGVSAWARRDPVSAMALNGVALNSMRFMLEAAGIGHEGPSGTVKLQGLVLAWLRVLEVWFDDDATNDRTMAALDRELDRGGRLVARLDDLDRLAAPLRTFARALMQGGRDFNERVRERWQDQGRKGRDEDDGRNADRLNV
jgi:AcrR family transcriptional regulator